MNFMKYKQAKIGLLIDEIFHIKFLIFCSNLMYINMQVVLKGVCCTKISHCIVTTYLFIHYFYVLWGGVIKSRWSIERRMPTIKLVLRFESRPINLSNGVFMSVFLAIAGNFCTAHAKLCSLMYTYMYVRIYFRKNDKCTVYRFSDAIVHALKFRCNFLCNSVCEFIFRIMRK